MMYDDEQNPKHGDQLVKLNRVSGQIEGIKTMINEQRYCVDILNQLKAARAAIKSIEINILELHMKMCLEKSATSGDAVDLQQKINELCNLIKKF